MMGWVAMLMEETKSCRIQDAGRCRATIESCGYGFFGQLEMNSEMGLSKTDRRIVRCSGLSGRCRICGDTWAGTSDVRRKICPENFIFFRKISENFL